MPEETYPQHKEDKSTVAATPRRVFAEADAAGPLKVYRTLRRRPSRPGEDYSAFKATIASAVAEIKLEIHDQHQQTRAEVQTVRRDVLAAVKASPAEYLKLVSEFGALFLLFALVVRFILKIELVNTAFAVFMLFACILYWSMANLKQRSEKRAKHPQA